MTCYLNCRVPRQILVLKQNAPNILNYFKSWKLFCSRSPSHTAPATVPVAPEEQICRFWDKLSQVGLPDDVDVQTLFEPSGMNNK